MPLASFTANSRAFVRTLNVLLKYARMYGTEHARTARQFDSAWGELAEAIQAAEGDSGLLLGATGSQLLLDGVPLETTPAERSFADLLSTSGVASVAFGKETEREDFAKFVQAFIEPGAGKAGTLAERLHTLLGKGATTRIRVNEIRFVVEDAAYAEARFAAEITAASLGADAELMKEWFRSPQKMIQLIAAAEGASRGGVPGGSRGPHSAYGTESEPGSAPVTRWIDIDEQPDPSAAVEVPVREKGADGSPTLSEKDMMGLLRLLSDFGEASQERTYQLDAQTWRQKFGTLGPTAQITLRQGLSAIAASAPGARMDEAALMKLAEDLAIRFALDRFQRGEVRVNAVREMLGKMNGEMETLRKLLKSREDKLASAGVNVESHGDILDRQFWAGVPESGKRTVLLSSEAWCIPPRNVQQYVEDLMNRGEADTAGDILVQYATCVGNEDAEARRRVAIGLGQLAEAFSRSADERIRKALTVIGKQMGEERDPELQTLLGAAFVRLSNEASARRYFPSMQQALQSLAALETSRPSWVQTLRPRIGVENRIPDFIDEAVRSEQIPDGLIGVLQTAPRQSVELMMAQLPRTVRPLHRDRLVELASAMGGACTAYLRFVLQSETPGKAVNAIGLLSRLDPVSLDELLPARLADGGRSVHDAAVMQITMGGASQMGRLLANILDQLDPSAAPLAIDEMGMSGDEDLAPLLLRVAEGELASLNSEYLRVKAIEALGRLRAAPGIPMMRKFLSERKLLGWAHPSEIRLACAQSLAKLDPEWLQNYLPKSGLDAAALAMTALDPVGGKEFIRHRRYRRVQLPNTVPVTVTTRRGKATLDANVLSLEGGLLSGELQFSAGTHADMKISVGLRSINLQAVVRFVRSRQAGFETVGMNLEDRAKLRRLLLSVPQSPTDS
jgi:hypothetical protein